MDGISVGQLLSGGGVVGVVLFVFVAFLRGWFVTKREADVYVERAEKAEAANAELVRQNTELMEMARLGQATFNALRKAAEQ